MYEGLNPDDSFNSDEDFDQVFEHTLPLSRIPLSYDGVELVLTPANTSVRLFGEGMEDYSRVVVRLDDGVRAPIKPDDGFMDFLINCGFPTEHPEQLDETDKEFMDEYMQLWTEDANSELENLL